MLDGLPNAENHDPEFRGSGFFLKNGMVEQVNLMIEQFGFHLNQFLGVEMQLEGWEQFGFDEDKRLSISFTAENTFSTERLVREKIRKTFPKLLISTSGNVDNRRIIFGLDFEYFDQMYLWLMGVKVVEVAEGEADQKASHLVVLRVQKDVCDGTEEIVCNRGDGFLETGN